MELLLLDRSGFDTLYNCSFYTIDVVPLKHRQHTTLGLAFIVLFFAFELTYIPVLVVLWTKNLIRDCCYRLMFIIGIIDVMTLFFIALISGLFSMFGFVFCSNPLLAYLTGVFAFSLWLCASDVSIILTLNRCFKMANARWYQCLFEGRRVYFWLVPVFLHVIYFMLFVNPVVYSGIYASWFVNPHIGYYDDIDSKYFHFVHRFYNTFVCVAYLFIYTVFAVVLCTRKQSVRNMYYTPRERQLFLQVIMICFVNFVGAILYETMQFTEIPRWGNIAATFVWIGIHGLPSIASLLFNDQVRRLTWHTVTCRSHSHHWPKANMVSPPSNGV